jgi:hypothetical protein
MKLALLLTGLFLAGQAYADIGSVTELTGSAAIKRGKETIAVVKGTTVLLNDKVETKNGKLRIIFKDQTNVQVTEHSSLVIDDFVYDPKNAAGGKLNLKAAAGTVRYASGAIAGANPNAVNIKTPTAAIAVRGTDFVMAVNEIGGSMIMLMPKADCEQGTGLKGLTCASSGKIEVESGPNIVTLDQAFEATLVETLGSAPTPPMVVMLGTMPIGTNLLINTPKTRDGRALVTAARDAAGKTGDMKREDRDDKREGENRTAQDQSERGRRSKAEAEESYRKRNDSLTLDSAKLKDINVSDTSKENEHVYKIWQDKSQTIQIGTGYESLSANGNNYANIAQPMDSKILLIVTQDRQTDAFNFNTQSSKTYGMIVVNQNWR